MIEIFQSFSNREWASAFWLGVLIAVIASYKPARAPLKDLLKTFFQPVIVVPLILAGFYTAGEIYLLDRIGWWSLTNLKSSILWLVTFAFVAMFELASIKNRKSGMGKVTREILTITSLFLFVTELHSFSLAIELLTLPVVTLLALMAEFAKHKPEHSAAAKALGCIVAIIGFSYFGFSFAETIEKWDETATWATALDFLLPILLSVGFLPFLWVWQIYVVYSDTFVTLSIYGIEEELVPYGRWLALTRIGNDFDLLERWRKSIQSTRPKTKAELKHSLMALKVLRERETAPPVVAPDDGWSPYLAMQFMADMGYDTGYYHHGFDEEWYASTPPREIGDSPIFKNNIAYYVEGSEHAATALKLKLNVNDPAKAKEAEDMFVVGSLHLLEQAISFDAAERLKVKVAGLSDFVDVIPYGSVSLSRSDFIGGIEGGYSRTFQITRGAKDG